MPHLSGGHGRPALRAAIAAALTIVLLIPATGAVADGGDGKGRTDEVPSLQPMPPGPSQTPPAHAGQLPAVQDAPADAPDMQVQGNGNPPEGAGDPEGPDHDAPGPGRHGEAGGGPHHGVPGPGGPGEAGGGPHHGAPGEGGQEQITICHATGSATNPFVEITIAENAIAAHRNHQEGEDIIPAPAGGCPGPQVPDHGEPREDHPDPPEQITICHATGSATNPFVEITIPETALPAHRDHQEGEDIIPAPAGGCPGAVAPDPEDPDHPHSPGPPAEVTICHATGSVGNPFVLITIPVTAIPAHLAHQEGQDIIPAPPGGCPEALVQFPPPPPGPLNEQPPALVQPPLLVPAPALVVSPGTVGPAEQQAEQRPVIEEPGVQAETVAEQPEEVVAEGPEGVIGGETVATEPADLRPVSDLDDTGTRGALPARSSGERLPFTGLEAGWYLAFGVALLLAGLALRRTATGER